MTLEILKYLSSSGIKITVKELLRFKTANMFSKEYVYYMYMYFILKLCQRGFVASWSRGKHIVDFQIKKTKISIVNFLL